MSILKSTFIKRFQRYLLDWYPQACRDLPWRKNRTPYRVWISELMLQQTRVDQVIPYYQRFMKCFPTLRTLAEAPLEEILKAWEGLGYYARARNLHKTAQILKAKNGRFPRTRDGLLELPGIGSYTASAIASLVYKEPVSLLDGNVIRVLSRVFAWKKIITTTESKKQLEAWSESLLFKNNPGAFNEAMMELGALICRPENPLCHSCPLRSLCKGKTNPQAFPIKKRKSPIPLVRVGAGLIRNSKEEILIAKRHEKGMLGGLWEFPGGKRKENESFSATIKRELREELGIEVTIGKKFMEVYHSYSHFKLEMHVYCGKHKKGKPRTLDCADWAWCSVKKLNQYPFSRADLKVIEKILEA